MSWLTGAGASLEEMILTAALKLPASSLAQVGGYCCFQLISRMSCCLWSESGLLAQCLSRAAAAAATTSIATLA